MEVNMYTVFSRGGGGISWRVFQVLHGLRRGGVVLAVRRCEGGNVGYEVGARSPCWLA